MVGAPEKLRGLVETAAVMTPRQREIVQRDIRVLERALRGEAMPYYGGDPTAQSYDPASGPLQGGGAPSGHVFMTRDLPVPDRAGLEKNLQACHQTLTAGAPPTLSASAKNTLFQWYKEESAKYVEGMPSHDQMWRPLWQNVQLHVRHREANKKRVRLLQNIHRILEPDDDVFHMEGFRPEKAAAYNGPAFRNGYDAIQWTDEKELELQAQELDDETYFNFLQYRAQGISSPKLFQDKLGISRQQYEACVARLGASAAGMVDLSPEDEEEAAQTPILVPTATKKEARGHKRKANMPDLEGYSAMLLTLLTEGALDEVEAADILQQLDPEQFSAEGEAAGVARTILQTLVVSGQAQMVEGKYRVEAE